MSLRSDSIAARYPLPASPIKGPLPKPGASGGAGTPQATPKKASDLIRMFESRKGISTDPLPAQPSFAPSSSSPQLSMPPPTTQSAVGPPPSQPSFVPSIAQRSASITHTSSVPLMSRSGQLASSSSPVQQTFAPVPGFTPTFAPPSSYRPSNADENIFNVPSSPPRQPSPLSQVRTMIASWRARSGSPSQRVVGSPSKGGETPRLFGRDRAWNVSIRRRKRHEGREQVGLAESGEEPQSSPIPIRYDLPGESGEESGGFGGDGSATPSARTLSVRSAGANTIRSEGPKQLTGEVGSLTLVNMIADLCSHFARDHCITSTYTTRNLHHTLNGFKRMRGCLLKGCNWFGGQETVSRPLSCLIWIIARVRINNEEIETRLILGRTEVASTFSPTNPMAGDDLGAAAARRQGELAQNLYPFKLASRF